MNIFKVYLSVSKMFWLILFSFAFVVKAEVHLISLGNNCEPAMRLRSAGLRIEAYPFDWLNTKNFHGLLKVLEDDFLHFLNPLYFEHFSWGIKNTYYDIVFRHDFPNTDNSSNIGNDFLPGHSIVENYLDFLSEVQKKYDKRISRLYERLNSEDKVIFFRTFLNPRGAKLLVELLSQKYPKLNFLLAVLHEENDRDWEENSSDIPHVRAFKMTREEGLIWWPVKEWNRVFRELGLAINTKRKVLSVFNVFKHKYC